jgi:hypothetical protein
MQTFMKFPIVQNPMKKNLKDATMFGWEHSWYLASFYSKSHLHGGWVVLLYIGNIFYILYSL